MTAGTTTSAADFNRRWDASGAAERPQQPTRLDDRDNVYVFERNVIVSHGDGSTSIGRIDIYKQGQFICKAKQGSDQPGEKLP